jgi:hypothetical protein
MEVDNVSSKLKSQRKSEAIKKGINKKIKTELSSPSMLDLNQKGFSKGETPKISGSSSYDNLFNS